MPARSFIYTHLSRRPQGRPYRTRSSAPHSSFIGAVSAHAFLPNGRVNRSNGKLGAYITKKDKHGKSQLVLDRIEKIFLFLRLKTLFEFVEAAAAVNKFLTPGKERVTLRANLNLHFLVFRSRLNCHFFAACALHRYFFVCWVNTFFHVGSPVSNFLVLRTYSFSLILAALPTRSRR